MAARAGSERVLALLLIPAMVLAVLVLMGVTLRNSLQLEALRERSVLEATDLLANEKALRLDKRIIEQDNVVRALADPDERERFAADWHHVAPVQTPTIRAIVLVDLSSSDHTVVAFASRGTLAEDEAFRRLLLKRILRDLTLGTEHPDEVQHLHASYAGHVYLLSYWQRHIASRNYLVVAWHDVPGIVHTLFPSLHSDQEANIRVNVIDSEGRVIWGPPVPGGGVTLGRQFQTTLYRWRLDVTNLQARELGAVVAQKANLELVMVSLSLTVVVAGLIVVVLAAGRARRLSALKSEFVANVSHELKTPLASIRMFAEMLSSGRVENEAKRQQYLQIINSESERLSALIENVLDFSRAEKGKAAFDLVEVDLPALVERAVQACRPRSSRTAIELAVDGRVEPVLADPRFLEVAVTNLIDNALKYAPDAEHVWVKLRQRGAYAELRVTDEGPGIPAGERRRIFERFVRGSSAETKKARGSGIGLALVRQIAEAHGGKAAVEPAHPQGSTFIVTIPVLRRPAAQSSGIE